MWNGRIYNAPPDEEFKRLMKKLRDARTKTKIHQETCPNCGAKLVNLYRKSTEDSRWMCKKCWDKDEEAIQEFAASLVKNNTPACESCQVHADALKSAEPAACAWYIENVVCGDKSVKSCPNYKPAEVDSNG